ncbi:hypothetical protein ASG67_04725 [Sphingomonas sp. Leaf339]|nr:hypothetical protein ASG67_04725 [Sphingomonas sp. Leaf339]
MAVAASGLIDSHRDPRLMALAKRTRVTLHAQWAGVTVISAESQHVIAASGGMLGIYRRSTSISSYVVNAPDAPFVVLDASKDERLAGSPFVYDGLIRFYAGVAFRDRDGHALGALCITDAEPRDSFSDEEIALLTAFAGEVVA